jgi:hypothetical protein
MCDVISQVVGLSTLIGQPQLALPLVKMMIDQTQSVPNEFTVLHTDFLRLCINGRFYGQALPMIKKRLTSVKPYYKIDTEEEEKAKEEAKQDMKEDPKDKKKKDKGKQK